jgi:hypothetical protein
MDTYLMKNAREFPAAIDARQTQSSLVKPSPNIRASRADASRQSLAAADLSRQSPATADLSRQSPATAEALAKAGSLKLASDRLSLPGQNRSEE